jgi:hypothetical protein
VTGSAVAAGVASGVSLAPIFGEILVIAGLMTPDARLTPSEPSREFSSSSTCPIAGTPGPWLPDPVASRADRVSVAGMTSAA